MKNIVTYITLCLLTISTVGSYAQEKFATYDNTYIGKTFEIQLSLKNQDLYIDAMSLDELYDKGGLRVRKEQQQEFLNSLSKAKTKYNEWVRTAKENNVLSLDKSMNIKSTVGSYFFYGSEWKFQIEVNLTFDFQILEDKDDLKYLLIIKTGELKAFDNEHLKVDGFLLVFSSEEEIETFSNKISRQKIEAFIPKPDEQDLFKE